MPAYALDAGARYLSLRLHRGDEFVALLGFVREPSEEPLNLTGYTLTARMTLFNSEEQVAEFTVKVVDAAKGLAMIELSEDQTEKIEPGTYRWRLKWVAPGDSARTLIRGACEVMDERRAA
jgi:hypothetical protein